jgi:hypothetical protein
VKLEIAGSIRGNQNGALQIDTGYGTTTIGPMNSAWSHFFTDRPAFYFDKPILLGTGVFGAYVGNDFSFQTEANPEGAPRMTIKQTTGYVGIGTTAPLSKLGILGNLSLGATYGAIAAPPSGLIVEGNVGIGTTSPISTLSVGGVGVVGASIYGKDSIGVYGDGSDYGVYGNGGTYGVYGITTNGNVSVYGTNNSTGYGVYGINTSTGYALYCNATGANKCGGNQAWFNASDRRLKENIIPISNALEKVLKLQGVTYNMKNDPLKTLQMGFIAQDVLPYVPEVVAYDKNNDYYGMQTSQLTALLVNAIQEQQTQITSLSTQLLDLTLTATGDLEIKNNSQTPYVYDGNLNAQNQILKMKDQNYSLKLNTGEIIEKIGAFTEVMVGKIKVGLIETENAIVENTLIAKNIVVENIQISGKTIEAFIDERIQTVLNSKSLLSPITTTKDIITTGTAQLNEIVTNEIKPQNQDLAINLDKNDPNAGKLAKLVIKGLEGKTVTTLDAAGNASFSGQIIADSLQINNNASVSGKLIAKEIESENINNLSSNVQDLGSNINDIQKLLADIKNQPVANPNYYQNLNSNVETQNFASLQAESLTITGNSNLYNVSVSNSLLVGTTFIDQGSIISLASELKLSALAKINLFDGAVIIAKDGTITTQGEIIAKKGVRTNEIKGLTDTSQVIITNPIINNLSISDKYLEATNSAAIIAAPDNFEKNGLFASAIETATASAGIGILPENTNGNPNEVVIYNNNIKKDSLVYLTPTSDYPSSNQLTVVQKEYTSTKPYFKVVSATPSVTPIKFNWLIIN